MDTSMLEKDALVALLDKLRELAAQEDSDANPNDRAISSGEERDDDVQATGRQEDITAAEALGDDEDEGLPLFEADDKPPMRKRSGMTMGGGSIKFPSAPAPKKGRYK